MFRLSSFLQPRRRFLPLYFFSPSHQSQYPSPSNPLKPYLNPPNTTTAFLLFPDNPKPFSSQTLTLTQTQLLTGEKEQEEGDDGRDGPHLCPGCGVHMQDSDPSHPGFFSRPSPKSLDYHAPLRRLPDSLIPNTLKSGNLSIANQDQEEEDQLQNPNPKPLVCTRCHSLRHYGRVKNPTAESLLPSFDFDRTVAPKILSPSGPRSLALLVADAADFHGSFPRSLSRLISSSHLKHSDNWKENKPANVPRALLVVTKVDLLPSSVTPERLEDWARSRAHEMGSVRLSGVHLVSAVKDWGVRRLVDHVAELAGPRGTVWAIGVQNVGKSTLINAMGKCVGGRDGALTEAPAPGTTLGIVKVDGVLGGQAKLFDTPGILHPYQITVRLTREEQRMVHVGKELRPRTYRIKAGHTVHIGGLMRVDIEELSVDSIYLTVWASPLLPLHMGKTESASKMMEEHFGRQLQPPIGENRVAELGKWERKKFTVSGNSWNASSVDIAVAGLGWVAVGLKGEAVLGVWTYDGVDVVSRSSLIPVRARIFEEAGFTVSKVVSQADSIYNKLKHIRKEKTHGDTMVKLPDTSSEELESDMKA